MSGEGQYRIGFEIGSGTSGKVYDGRNNVTGKEVAIKVTNLTNRNSVEYDVYKNINGEVGFAEGIATFSDHSRSYLVMERLGPDLMTLFKLCKKQFSLKTIALIGEQLVTRIQYIHSRGYLHNSIKPQNMVIGLGKKSNIIHLIDFGAVEQKVNATATTTEYVHTQFALNCAKMEFNYNRIKEIEAIGFILVYFINGGCLPNDFGVDERISKYYRKLFEKDDSLTKSLCEECPMELKLFFEYTRNSCNCCVDDPDYEYLKSLFQQLHAKQLQKFDWEERNVKIWY